MPRHLHTLWMFDGTAEEAMTFYETAFSDASIETIAYFGRDEAGLRGSVKCARFALAGTTIDIADAPSGHRAEFSSSTALCVTCDDVEQFERAFVTLSDHGSVLLPPAENDAGERTTLLTDRYGLCWKLSVESGRAPGRVH